MIKDSGTRRNFDTGAVRDIQEGKGRPTLMPLKVVSKLLESLTEKDLVISELAMFVEHGMTTNLYHALTAFAAVAYGYSTETMLLEVSKHFEEGAKKYGDNNWQKGIPVDCYLDSAIRHYLKFKRGDTDEPHDRAFVWNIMCCIWEVDYRKKT
jgi:hypothetical protein